MTGGFWCIVFGTQIYFLCLYLFNLSRLQSYGWIVPAISIGGFGILLLLRWNRKFSWPTSRTSQALVICGATLSLATFVRNWEWLASVGFLLTAFAFVVTHRDRQQSSLVSAAYPLLAILVPPFGSYLMLQGFLDSFVQKFCGFVLSDLRIPHIQYETAFQFEQLRVSVADLLFSPISWPLFLSIALLHSGVFKRSIAATFFNVVFAFFVCIFHQVIVVVSAGFFQADSIHSIVWISAIASYLLFASCERGLLSLLAAIPDNLHEGAILNPVVFVWNRLLSKESDGDASAESEPTLGAKDYSVLIFSVAMATVGFVGTLISFGTFRPSESLDSSAALSAVFVDEVDSRALALWDSDSTLIRHFQPRRETIFEVTTNGVAATAVESNRGWRPDSGPSLLEVSGIEGKIVRQRFSRSEERLIVLKKMLQGAAAKPDSGHSNSAHPDLSARAVFLTPPNETELQSLTDQFKQCYASLSTAPKTSEKE